MNHIETSPHEVKANLTYYKNGLSPYWTLTNLLINEFDGNHETTVDIDGETWDLGLSYQKGGIQPRATDPIDSDGLYEPRISAQGRGQRKANYHIRPRFQNMRDQDGEHIDTPFDHIDHTEGISIKVQGSNLEPIRYRELLPEFVQAFASDAETYIKPDYFDTTLHEMSNIEEYERYIRLRRRLSSKVVDHPGIFHRLFMLSSNHVDSKLQYKANNQDVVGYNHRLVVPQGDMRRLFGHHDAGKQIKHYHPKHTRKNDKSDPLYHPKVGVLAKKSLTGETFDWANREKIRQEIDETLINTLYWADVPIKPDTTTYVADDHFDVDEDDRVELVSDPTPDIEAEQDQLLMVALRDLCDSDLDILDTLVDSAGKHTAELQSDTGWSSSTVYRALDRLGGIVENNNGEVKFSSKKIKQDIASLVESVEHQIETVADRVANLYDLDTRRAASSAWEKWCTKYGAKIVGETDSGKPILRIETALSRLKTGSKPRLEDVLDEGLTAWAKDGRDTNQLRYAVVRWTDGDDSTRHLIGAIANV